MSFKRCYLEKYIEDLVNLRHPCVFAPIDFDYWSQFGILKIIRFYAGSGSLPGIVFVSPVSLLGLDFDCLTDIERWTICFSMKME
jgi:hypothetical protein